MPPSSLPSMILTSTIDILGMTDAQSIPIQSSSILSASNDWNSLDAEFWEPIKLSTLAGLSTCVGASVAFVVGGTSGGVTTSKNGIIGGDFVPIPESGEVLRSESEHAMSEKEGSKEEEEVAVVGPDLMAFSLALAGSVMITVCIVSIIPECLFMDIDNVNVVQSLESGNNINDSWSVSGQIISSQILLQRSVGFAVGWGVYALLSKWLAVLPEEEEWSGILLGEGSNDTTWNKSDSSTNTQQGNAKSTSKQSSWRLTILLFLSLLLHNFPEGLAVAFSAASSSTSMQSPHTTVPMVVEESPAKDAIKFDSTARMSSITAGTISFNNKHLVSNEALPPHPAITSSIVFPSPHTPSSPPAEQRPEASSSLSSSETSSTSTSSLASIVALGIALHNIPEGIAIAIPCMAARPDQPFLAFGLASLSGLAEPIGAFIGLMMLRLRNAGWLQLGIGNANSGAEAAVVATSNGQDMGDTLAFVAGIMLAVAVCELLPEADRQRRECVSSNSFAWGIVIGVGVMILTELYLGA